MKWTDTGFGVTQQEATEWAIWFVKKNGLDESITALLIGFMQSGEEWSKRPLAGEIKCPKCSGRGHNNLYLIGSTTPGLCDNCGGTGKVEAVNAEG